MSIPLLTPLVSGDEIKAELRKRSSPYIFKTVTAKNKKLLKEKVKLEKEDGWEWDRDNVKSTRMKQTKPSDELIENELWCLLAKMGFKELSLGRNFHMEVGKKIPARQIDVFAKDDETAIIIECTQIEQPKIKSMVPLIEKLMAIREGVHNSIMTHYGRDAQLKVKLVIATKNITWRAIDIEKCKEAGIAIIADDELEYYLLLVEYLKHASRYQLLAHLFEGQKISGLAQQVAATRGKMGGVKFYSFLIKPDDLLKIAYIGHKSSRNTEDIETYQRMAKPARLNQIAKYIESGGKFPTNIVVNIKTTRKKGLDFETREKIGNESFGILHLPQKYAAAWIIDGQHRLYGFAYAAMNDSLRCEKSTLPVLAFENLSSADEMNMFIDINSKQVKVQTALLMELYADLHWDSPDFAQRHQALLARIAARLNTTKTSPICQRIVVAGKTKNSFRCLTQTSIAIGIDVSRLLGSSRKDKIIDGPLSDATSINKSLNKSVIILSQCLQQFAEAMPAHWELGDARGGYLCTNNAIRAIFLLIYDICTHLERESTVHVHMSLLSADEVVEDILPFLKPVVDFFKNADAQQIYSVRRIGSSLAAVKQQSMAMCVLVNKAFPDFKPTGLQEYIDTRNIAVTNRATLNINHIDDKIYVYVVSTLEQEFGKDDWFDKAVPDNVKEKTMREWQKDGRTRPEFTYLNLIHYGSIAMFNWELMKKVFALGNKDIDNKSKCVKWIGKLNEIRKKTHHAGPGIISVEETHEVDDLVEQVNNYFVM